MWIEILIDSLTASFAKIIVIACIHFKPFSWGNLGMGTNCGSSQSCFGTINTVWARDLPTSQQLSDPNFIASPVIGKLINILI